MAPLKPHTLQLGQTSACEGSIPTWKSLTTLPVSSTDAVRDLSPYWNDCIAAMNSMLWLPIGTGWPDSALNSSSGWSSRTAAQSWFSTSRMPAPSPSSPRIYSPSCIRSVAGCTGSDVAERPSFLRQRQRRRSVHPSAAAVKESLHSATRRFYDLRGRRTPSTGRWATDSPV